MTSKFCEHKRAEVWLIGEFPTNDAHVDNDFFAFSSVRKVFCRQGRRFAHTTHTPIQCPSSSTSCGYIEFPSPDRKVGLDNVIIFYTGIYECVDNGMLSATVDADNKNAFQSLFAALCGPVPQCSSLHIDSLNPTFSKYIITTYEIELETLTSRTLRFCCSLFHSTLQKLVNSGMDKLQYDDRKRVKKQIDDYDGVSAMQLSFDYEEDNESFEFVSKVPETIHSDTISSRRVPQHPSKIISNASVTVETLHYQNYDSTGVRDEMHCVYRHFNDEFYRYCLMVHQRKDGDRNDNNDDHGNKNSTSYTSSSSTTTTTSTTATTKKPLTTRKLTASRPPFIIRKPLNRRTTYKVTDRNGNKQQCAVKTANKYINTIHKGKIHKSERT
uniref:CUB domain-containing protein n=1 Tax=Heterorhabditis bacteriophora TaxID=37862 RepID=A0A1I7WHY1_HETBA